MKVLHVIPSVSSLRGGPSVMIRTLTRGLAQAGLEVHVTTTDDDGRERLHVSHGVPLIAEGVTYWYFRRQTRFYTFSWPLSRWLAQHVREYDLVHIHALFSYAAIPAAFWASRRGIPYLVRPLGVLNRWGMQNRHPWLKRLSFRSIENRILAGAAAIHYTSEQERLEAAELGVKQRSVVIPNAVDLTAKPDGYRAGWFRAQYPQLTEHIIILFLSRLDSKKGLDLLLPAFAQVRRRCPRVVLVLAGEGDPDFTAHLRQETVRLSIASDVVWAGFLAEDEKWATLADADIFVLPSYSENFGVAVVEAMAVGLPVVISDQVGIHREVAEARAGLVVECQVNEVGRAISHLVDDARSRSRMAANGRRLAQRRFSLAAVTNQLVEVYTKICKPLLKEAVA